MAITMEFRTQIKPLKMSGLISHSTPVLSLGSCFADEVSALLIRDGFNVLANPFGTIYNPRSIARTLQRLADNVPFGEDMVARRSGAEGDVYCCWGGSSIFDTDSCKETLTKINGALATAASFVRQAGVLTITFGTAHCYYLAENGMPVVNCHKFPESNFIVRRLTVEEIVDEFTKLICALRQINPKLEILITISPYRYKKYGLHASQLDKSILLLATERICELPGVIYFPSYEALIDDLRDYRFYAMDMVHPSVQAVEYVYDLFCESFLAKESIDISRECRAISDMRAHRPFNAASAELHNNKLALMEGDFIKRHPMLTHFVKSKKSDY